ncbi:MAG: hypothetical protein APF82_05245 [Sphingomonadales bacterium BRH_c42]|nr:MAG: hypothetical protein APF82_05245 [Sphingomonadales bacterium BRH_c42]
MNLFKPDLYRSLAIGFALGVALITMISVPHWDGDLADPAQAATSPDALQTTGQTAGQTTGQTIGE